MNFFADLVTTYYLNKNIATEKKFLQALGPVLTNAIGWYGYPALRDKKNKKVSEEEAVEE